MPVHIAQACRAATATALTVAVVVVVIAVSAVPANAAADTSWSVRTWQIPDGSNNTITGIAQSPDRYLWIATSAGLNRFDGVRFEHHGLPTSLGLPSTNVRLLLPSRDGGLWLALDGAVVYLKLNMPPRVIRQNLPGSRADNMVEDELGAVWIGYRGGRVCRIMDGKPFVFDQETGLPASPTVIGDRPSVAVDTDGQVWVALGHQLGVIRDGQFVQMIQTETGSSVGRANGGGIWVFVPPNLCKFDEKNGLRTIARVPLNSSVMGAARLLEDSRGALWIGTLNAGLFRYDGSTIENVATPQARITCLAEDHEGNLWAGSDAGLNRIAPRAIELQGVQEGLPLGSVSSLCQAPDGRIWGVMANGSIMVRGDDKWQPAPFVFEDAATCLAIDQGDGAIWIGTRSRRLHCWKDGKLTSWTTQMGLKANMITSLLVTRGGDLWVGSTGNHVQRLRAGALTTHPLPLARAQVAAMLEDQSGDIWVGRTGRPCLLRITAGGDQVIDETPPTPAAPAAATMKAANALHLGEDGAMYIAIYGSGLGRLKDRRLSLITAAQGVNDECISQILSDGHGWLWLGGDKGLFKIAQREIEDFAEGKIQRVQSIRYGGDEGLPPLQAKYGTCPSALRSADGRLWMTMATGLAVVHPQRVRERSAAPPVHIERVLVNDDPIASAASYFPTSPHEIQGNNIRSPGESTLALPPNYQRLTFDFTALTFSAPEDVRFRYRLEGFDDRWSDTAELRRATYPRLPAGNYRFRVIASNADGIWNETGAGTAITVAPFIWQTWWFLTLAILTAAAAILLIVRYVALRRLRRRLQVLEQRSALDRERARIARDIHDDLGHGLTQIVLLSDFEMQEPLPVDEANAQLRQIASTARQGIKSLDETVWAINPRNDTLSDVIDYLGHFVMQSVRSAGMKCELDLPDDPPADVVVPSEVRHNLFLAVKEAVNNVIRHAQASKVTLSIARRDGTMIIKVEDDGRGFDLSAAGTESGQDGLANMRQRMHDVGGTFAIHSASANGTKIELALSIARPPPRRNGINGNGFPLHSTTPITTGTNSNGNGNRDSNGHHGIDR